MGEIAHIHPGDNFIYMVLSPRDAVAAFERGWANGMDLQVSRSKCPPNHVMVYSPRNQEDLTVLEELLKAAIAYAIQPVHLNRS